MRKINEIIVHCSAAKNSSARQIDNWHKKRGWDCIGYHYVVRKSGKLEKGRDINTIGAHCFPFGTDLLTPNGWKDVSLVEIEDKIACYKNNEIFFEKQIRKIKSKANVFISAIGKNYSFISTVGHEFLYKKIL